MGIFDVLTGKLGKRQHAIAQKAFEVLESEFADNQEILDTFARTAITLTTTDKSEYDRFTKNGRNLFRNLGLSVGNEQIFNDIAAGSMFFSPTGQAMLSLMIFELCVGGIDSKDRSEQIPELVKKIESYCSRI
ncbi:MAG TPA: hypothetical protein VIF37_19185 [Methylobacter sp.]